MEMRNELLDLENVIPMYRAPWYEHSLMDHCVSLMTGLFPENWLFIFTITLKLMDPTQTPT